MLPRHKRREEQTGDIWCVIPCVQAFTDLILADLGNPFLFDLDELGERRLASVFVELNRQKGTARGIINVVRFFFGVEIEAVTAYSGEGLVLGESALDDDLILAPSSGFAGKAIDVVISVLLSDAQRKQLRAVVEHLKPAHKTS